MYDERDEAFFRLVNHHRKRSKSNNFLTKCPYRDFQSKKLNAEQNGQLYPGELEQLFDDYTTCLDISLVKS